MIFKLICKKREKAEENRKWVNYSTLHKGKWYNIKFVKECPPPQTQKIADGVYRAFIELTPDCVYDINTKGVSATIFVETYKILDEKTLSEEIKKETASIEKYRADREKARVDFLSPNDSDEAFFL